MRHSYSINVSNFDSPRINLPGKSVKYFNFEKFYDPHSVYKQFKSTSVPASIASIIMKYIME